MISDILSHLDRVRSSGKHQWVACCPSHNDKSPSLSITEKDDGRILLHCFAGCSTYDILGSIGLGMEDLFPEPLGHHLPKVRSAVSPRQVLMALVPESLCIALIGSQMSKGIPIDNKTQEALLIAVSRVSAAHSYMENL